ncbi:MAG: RluA family pseudouridine synthase [Thermodesulfovibrionales bacterium]|nr:RluA family pseudouridine synthase [Thermodesulfovibrionales bacterium]
MIVTVKKSASLQEFLLSRGFKRNRIRQLLKYGSIYVNGKSVRRYDHQLKEGDRLSIEIKKDASEILQRFKIKIIYEDKHIIVIDKPPGLLSIATEKERERTAYYILNEYLKNKNERVFIVHRLDRDTSGIMIFAKTEEAKRLLQAGWNEAEKTYICLVEGRLKEKEGIITGYLKETDTFLVYPVKSRVDSKYAATEYRVLKEGRDYSLLEVKLLTGRKNQIRVHLSAIGHPVAGDKKYGAKTDPLRRLCLHAESLSFKHPVTGKFFRLVSKSGFLEKLLGQKKGLKE